MPTQNILVTGGTGLIGQEAVRQLVHAGHRVTVLDFAPNRDNVADLLDDIELVPGDVTDLSFLLGLFRRNKIERVLHLAAFIMHESQLNPMRGVHVNVVGTANIFDAALARDVERVCYASTIAVLGPAQMYPTPATESSFAAPMHPYGAAKRLVEVTADIYRNQFGLGAVGLRPALAYGMGRLTGGTGVFNSLIRDVALGHPAKYVFSGGADAAIQPIYNVDMARAFIAATTLEALPPLPIYNAPVNQTLTGTQVVETLRQLVPDADITTEVGGINDWISPVIDGSAAQRDLGVIPEYDLRAGAADMITRFRQLEAIQPAA